MTKLKIIGVYLAAGQSSRFNGDKLAELLWGQALGSIALDTALQSKLTQTLVITKESDLSWLSPFLKNPACTQVFCKKAVFGQAESLKCALPYAKKLKADAILIMLADQPLITKTLLNKLIKNYEIQPERWFVASKYQGEMVPPILISANMFPLLNHLSGDVGAKRLLLENENKGNFISFSNPWYFFDVDTTIDFQLLQSNFNQQMK